MKSRAWSLLAVLAITSLFPTTIVAAPTPAPEDPAAANLAVTWTIEPINPSFNIRTRKLTDRTCPGPDLFHVLMHAQKMLALLSYREPVHRISYGLRSRPNVRIAIQPIPDFEDDLDVRHVMWALYQCTISIAGAGFQDSRCDLGYYEGGHNKQLGTIYYQISGPALPGSNTANPPLSEEDADDRIEQGITIPLGNELTARSPPSLLPLPPPLQSRQQPDEDPLTITLPAPPPLTIQSDNGITARVGRFTPGEGPGYITLALLHCLIDLASKVPRRALTSPNPYTCKMQSDVVFFEWMRRPEAPGGSVSYEDVVRGLALLPGELEREGQSGQFTFVIFKAVEGNDVPVACGRSRSNERGVNNGGGGDWGVDAGRIKSEGVAVTVN